MVGGGASFRLTFYLLQAEQWHREVKLCGAASCLHLSASHSSLILWKNFEYSCSVVTKQKHHKLITRYDSVSRQQFASVCNWLACCLDPLMNLQIEVGITEDGYSKEKNKTQIRSAFGLRTGTDLVRQLMALNLFTSRVTTCFITFQSGGK